MSSRKDHAQTQRGLSQLFKGGDYHSLCNMRKSRPREVKAFLQGHTASNQWDSNLGQYDSKACDLNHNMILPETYLDSDSAIKCFSDRTRSTLPAQFLKQLEYNKGGNIEKCGVICPKSPFNSKNQAASMDCQIWEVDPSQGKSGKSDSSLNCRT